MTREDILKLIRDGANLCGADLRSANLCGADLRGANLSSANLCGANLCALHGITTEQWAAYNEGPLNRLAHECHAANATWWHHPATGARLERNKGELLCLIHSEISEAMEGERKGLMDDHLPHRRMAEVELADALIRIFDYAGAFGYDLDGAVAEKRAYNARRTDHKPAARLADGGKKW